MDSASISIVTVNFNSGNLLHRCVTSALACQSVGRIMIADNGSSDHSLTSLAPLHSRLTILHNEHNLGFSRANNLCIPFLETPYVLFLNPDSTVAEDTLQQMLNFMQTHADVGMAGPLILNEDGSEQRGCRRDEPKPLAALNTLIGKREAGINKVGTTLPTHPIEVDAISGAFMFVRRAALEDVGPMDEGYFLHCEDLDWCKRFRDKGWKVMFLPHVSITHFKGGSSRKRVVRVEWHKHKGMVRYYRKFYKDKYPAIVMYAVYAAVWGRFALMLPIWRLRSALK